METGTNSSTLSEDMTIGELAAHFGLATHVLRHWEAMGVLTPVARVNGRRRYRQDHVYRVALILRCKEAGLSLRQLREFLSAPDPSTRRALFERHRVALQRRIAQAQAAKAMIEHALECSYEDFTQCPNFQRNVAMVLEERLPPHAVEDLPGQAREVTDSKEG
jgi:MerR family copper efflux transcriptional regulator